MRKAVYILGLVILGIFVIVSLQAKSQTSATYHVTLADPKLYNNGIFTDNFKIQKGTYQFSFVPNGDSPQNLSISLKGDSFSFNEDYTLNGTIHNTGISNYDTWDYLGNKIIDIPQNQELYIKINPHGNVFGSVSVYLNRK